MYRGRSGRYQSQRGRSSPSANRRGSPAGGYSHNASWERGKSLQLGRESPEIMPVCVSGSSPAVRNITSGIKSPKLVFNRTGEDFSPKKEEFTSVVGSTLNMDTCLNEGRTQQEELWDTREGCDNSPHLTCTSLADERGHSQICVSGCKDGYFQQEIQCRTSFAENTASGDRSDDADSLQKEFSFDICVEKNGNAVKLKTPLHLKNKEKRNELKRQIGEKLKVLRPGMVLLKGYLPLMEQVEVTKACRGLGQGPGGFYQPCYQDGAKLHLKMMCLGKNWDPLTSMYSDERPTDGAKPPPIPVEFQQLVKRAMHDAHAHLESVTKGRNVKDILPSMSPNICIVNFYPHSGRLGLHQDKDESQESLGKGLPVVSLSLGDSAEFLYGEQRDIEKAEKIVLESGDVLVFGGKSRHIFHGVSRVIPDTAPKSLLVETNLRPGRLNLTFREY